MYAKLVRTAQFTAYFLYLLKLRQYLMFCINVPPVQQYNMNCTYMSMITLCNMNSTTVSSTAELWFYRYTTTTSNVPVLNQKYLYSTYICARLSGTLTWKKFSTSFLRINAGTLTERARSAKKRGIKTPTFRFGACRCISLSFAGWFSSEIERRLVRERESVWWAVDAYIDACLVSILLMLIKHCFDCMTSKTCICRVYPNIVSVYTATCSMRPIIWV